MWIVNHALEDGLAELPLVGTGMSNSEKRWEETIINVQN